MTVKQRKFVKNKLKGMPDTEAARQAGYGPGTSRNAAQIVSKSPDVIKAFQKAMKKAGIDDELLATRMREGIDAQETKFFQKDGIVTDSRDVVAYGERRAMLELAARMKNLLPKEPTEERPPVQIQIVHVCPEAEDVMVASIHANEADSAVEVITIGE